MSYQLQSQFGSGDDVDYTGSVAKSASNQDPTLPPEHDLVAARAAVSEVLSKGGKDTSLSWENPRTGARGTVTPIASAYSQDGQTCHDFLASYIRDGSESWLQGEACRAKQGRWEVRHMKRWQKT
jgi:hypothetical protein